MPRSGTLEKRGRLLYAVPIVAVLLVAGAFAMAYVLPPPGDVVMDFDLALSIQISNSTHRWFFVPPSIGVPGGTWLSHRYDTLGVEGRSPIYTVTLPQGNYSGFSLIHVRSRVMHNYTLGDFFDVWGQPLGPDRTLDFPATDNNLWEMCIGQPPFDLGKWRSEVLTRGKFISLVYYPVGHVGCL